MTNSHDDEAPTVCGRRMLILVARVFDGAGTLVYFSELQ
jgi:hypothetical protein